METHRHRVSSSDFAIHLDQTTQYILLKCYFILTSSYLSYIVIGFKVLVTS